MRLRTPGAKNNRTLNVCWLCGAHHRKNYDDHLRRLVIYSVTFRCARFCWDQNQYIHVCVFQCSMNSISTTFSRCLFLESPLSVKVQCTRCYWCYFYIVVTLDIGLMERWVVRKNVRSFDIDFNASYYICCSFDCNYYIRLLSIFILLDRWGKYFLNYFLDEFNQRYVLIGHSYIRYTNTHTKTPFSA